MLDPPIKFTSLIKVISVIGRCGKSTLLRLIRDEILAPLFKNQGLGATGKLKMRKGTTTG